MDSEFPTPAYRAADQKLAELELHNGVFNFLHAEMEAKFSEIRDAYAKKLLAVQLAIEKTDKDLRKLEKKHKLELFSAGDRVELPHGSLTHHSGKHVVRARGVLEKLQELGWKDGIKSVESVDWDKLEEWPDVRLIEAGTERKPKEDFGYELRATNEAPAVKAEASSV